MVQDLKIRFEVLFDMRTSGSLVAEFIQLINYNDILVRLTLNFLTFTSVYGNTMSSNLPRRYDSRKSSYSFNSQTSGLQVTATSFYNSFKPFIKAWFHHYKRVIPKPTMLIAYQHRLLVLLSTSIRLNRFLQIKVSLQDIRLKVLSRLNTFCTSFTISCQPLNR
ncbi:hypothetical protein N7455_001746 [Penicillium solitum]|uniref:uncharacterized protein n=1 Tax=Penicillium solitum TaxID=60172 RepID=UPI0032C46CA0|nr:hypothetical protein N7455_001746 [Penicillium solitum]